MAVPSEIDFQFLAENSLDLICLVGLDLVMHYASPACRQLLGWSPEEMCGKGPDAFVLPEDLPVVAAAHQDLLINGADATPIMIRMRKKEGTFAWIEVNARIAKNLNSGEVVGIVLVMRDATARRLREQELEIQALRDGLTGLANRRLFDQVLAREWKSALHKETHLSLILIDIDHFKQLNDHYGHQFGDNSLRAVANTLNSTVGRASDLIARYGGEEYAVILPNTEPAGALKVAEDIRTNMRLFGSPTKATQPEEIGLRQV